MTSVGEGELDEDMGWLLAFEEAKYPRFPRQLLKVLPQVPETAQADGYDQWQYPTVAKSVGPKA